MLDIDKTLREATIPGLSEEDEVSKRKADTQMLVHGIVGRYGDFFAKPENRLEFIKDQSAKDFFRLSMYVNAKVRGEKPYQLRQKPEERLGGSLPMLHTPRSSDKLRAFSRGFDAIHEYLTTTDDPVNTQTEAVSMATEALIIWVHPFVDGNGRTSRFMGKLVEAGASDLDELAEETITSRARPLSYRHKLASKESELETADNEDIMLYDDERNALRTKAETLPNDVEATYLSVKRLLEDGSIRQSILEKAEQFRTRQPSHEVA